MSGFYFLDNIEMIKNANKNTPDIPASDVVQVSAHPIS